MPIPPALPTLPLSRHSRHPPSLPFLYGSNLAWSSKNFIAVGLGEQCFMYDCNSGKVDNVSGLTGGAGSISGGRESYISSCSWDPGGTQLVVAEGGFGLSSVSIYDVASSSRPVVAQLGGHIDRVNCIAWHPTDTHCLTAAGRDGVILMHDVRCPRTPCRRLAGPTSEVCGLAYNSMGVLASGSNDNASVIWDQSHTGHTAPVHPTTPGCGQGPGVVPDPKQHPRDGCR